MENPNCVKNTEVKHCSNTVIVILHIEEAEVMFSSIGRVHVLDFDEHVSNVEPDHYLLDSDIQIFWLNILSFDDNHTHAFLKIFVLKNA